MPRQCDPISDDLVRKRPVTLLHGQERKRRKCGPLSALRLPHPRCKLRPVSSSVVGTTMLRSLERATALIIVVLLLVASSTLIIRYLTQPGEITDSGRWGRVLAHFGTGKRHAPPERPHARARPELRLVSQQAAAYSADEPVPLGIQVSGEAAGLAVEIIGLPAGTAISSGRPLGAGAWRVPATEVGNAIVHPPPGFSGAIDLAVELRLADDTLVDRGSLRLEWMAKAASRPIESRPESAPDLALSAKAAKEAAAIPATMNAIRDFGSQEAQQRLNVLATGDVGIAVDRAEVARKVEPAPAKDAASVVASTKPKKHVSRLRNRARVLADDPYAPYAVYAAGARAGTDPDGKVRTAILKQYSWMN